MAHVLNDRIKETTTTTGTGTVNLAGAETGFETFVGGIGNGNTTYYAISHQTTTEFEIGLGTVNDDSPDTITGRTNANVISSSNSDNVVDFSAGTKDVFCTLPASKAITLDHQSVMNVVGSISLGDASNRVILSKGSDNKIAFETQASGGSATASNSGGVIIYANTAALAAATGNAVGDLGFVTANNKLYFRQTNGWYTVATVTNATPVISSAGNATYAFATDGTPIVVTVSATDAEGETITYAHTVSSGSLTNGGGTTATVVQGTGGNVNQFTVTPSTNSSYQGAFSLTFTAQDPNGNTATSSASAFTLSFATTNGAYDFTSRSSRLTATSSDFNISSSTPFTIEYWYMLKSGTTNSSPMFDMGTGNMFQLYLTGGDIKGYSSQMGGYWVDLGSGIGRTEDTWYHAAITGDGSGNTKVYIDGTQRGNTHNGSWAVTGGKIRINGYAGSGYTSIGIIGYFSDFRIVNGSMVYSGNFTRPSAPLTAITNTKFLTCQNSSGSLVDNSSSGHTLTTDGTVTPRAGVP